MNAMLNINIRVTGAQAQAQLAALTQRVNALSAAGARAAGSGGLGSMNRAFGMSGLEKFGKNLQWTGRQLEYNFTLPLILAGAASVKWALQNERASIQIRKVYGNLSDDAAMLDAELKALDRSFELLSSRFGVHQQEVINIAGAWAQAGAAGVGLAKATRLTLESMVLGEMEAVEATEGLIAVQSSYRLNTDQLRDALAQLNIVENQTSINFSGLIDVITRAGGVSRTAGIDIRHLAAMAASLVPATGSAAQAGNALRTMISRIMAPTGEAADLMGMMGLNIFEASWQAKNGVERIEAMAQAFDDLTQSQKTVVSAAVASRWQINRFDILMGDIALSLNEGTENQSAYARALAATADQSQANAVYAKELLTVLQSSPQAFKILTTTIQNALAKAILPLLPALVMILGYVARAVTWFSNLSPEVQGLALAFLFMLAAIGPVTRYIGSFTLLFTTVGKGIGFLLGHLWTLGGGLGLAMARVLDFGRYLLALPFRAVGIAAHVMWTAFVIAGNMAVAAIQVAAAGIVRVLPLLTSVGGALLSGAASMIGRFLAVMGSMAMALVDGVFIKVLFGGVQRVGAAITVAWSAVTYTALALWTIFTNLVMAGWALLPVAAAKVGALIGRAWVVTSMVASRAVAAIGLVFTSLPAVVAAVARAIVVIWRGFGTIMAALSAAIQLAMANPWVALGVAVAAIVGLLIYHFRDRIGDAVQWVIDAFNKLPQSIQDVFVSVVRVVSQAVQRVYEWLSYINPFARHSPSLVDQVARGVSTILDEYSRLRHISGVIRQAIAATEAFKAATGDAFKGLQLGEFQQQRADIVAVAPGAGDEVDRMVNSIFEMHDALELVNQQVREQGALVYDMEQAIQTGMKPWNDAIWENEQAQKRLRLEILRMEQAGQTIDGIKDRMAALAGEIEGLRAEREDLRLAGAGSDVLAGYDRQIAAMEEQHRAMQGMKDPIREVQDQLDELNRHGEMMQLERDLEFDPQLRELDIQQQKLRELEGAYRDIGGAVRDMETSLSSMASQARASMAELSHAEEQFLAAAEGDFEVPGGEAPPGLGREGDLADIEAFNAAMQAELDAALAGMGGMDMFGPFKDMWNSAWTWVKDTIGPYVGPVVDGIKSIWGSIDWSFFTDGWNALVEAFSGGSGTLSTYADSLKGYISSLWEVIKAVWAFLVEFFGPIFKWLAEQIGVAVEAIGGELKNWAPMWDKLTEAIGHVAAAIVWAFKYVIVPVIKVALGIIIGLWKLAWPILKRVLEPILRMIVGVIRGALEVIRGVISFVLDLINGDWGKAWDDILTIVDGVWDMIYAVIKFPIDLIIGLVRGLVEGIIGFFQWLWDVLVGNSIIPDMMNAILGWFEWLIAPVKLAWELLWAGIEWVWNNVAKPVFNLIKWYFENVIVPIFKWALDKIGPIWDLLWAGVVWMWDHVGKPVFDTIKWAIDNIVIPAFQWAKDQIGPLWDAIGGGIKWVWDNVIVKVFDAIKAGIETVGSTMTWVKDHVIGPVWDGIKTIISTAWDGIARILEPGINFFISAFNLLARAINAVAGALGLGFHIDEWDHIDLNPSQTSSGSRGAPQRVNQFAQGGIPAFDFGSHGGFLTKAPIAIVGEGSKTFPEYVIPTDPRHRSNALRLMESLGARMFGVGDIIGGIAQTVTSGGTNLLGGAGGAVVDVAQTFWDIIGEVWDVIGNIVGVVGDVAAAIADQVIQWGQDKLVGAGLSIRDAAWDVGAVVNPVDDIINIFRASGGLIPALANGGIVLPRPGGTLVRLGEQGRAEVVQPLPAGFTGSGNTYNFYGDLEFPNVTNGEDAEAFLHNLETLVE